MRERPKGLSIGEGVGGEAVPATSLDSLVKQVPLSILKDRLRRFLRHAPHTLPQGRQREWSGIRSAPCTAPTHERTGSVMSGVRSFRVLHDLKKCFHKEAWR